MLKIYGSMLCKDCVLCRQQLDEAGVEYTYLDFSDNLQNLKDFLKIRDEDTIFELVKERGGIGIPCILEESGVVSLQWDKYL